MKNVVPALLVAGGCGGAHVGATDKGVDPACAETAPAVTLGTGQWEFEPLTEGQPVVIVNGPQGGWHVWTSGQVTAEAPELMLHSTLEAPGFQQPLAGTDDAPWAIDLSEPATGSWDPAACAGEFFGQYTLVNDATPPDGKSYLDFICGLEGRELVLAVTITDPRTGEEASDVRTVRGQLDPANVGYCHSL